MNPADKMADAAPERLLKMREVVDRTSLSRSKLYDMMRVGKFPPPVHLVGRRTAWPESEVNRWIIEKVNASRSSNS